jgi:hypothetical protein
MKKLLLIFSLVISINLNAQFWQSASTGQTSVSLNVSEISYVDANTFWITNGDGSAAAANTQKWAKTLDGGLTWTNGPINLGNTSLAVSDLSAVSATTCYVLGSTNAASGASLGGVWKTADGGATWNRQTSASYNSPTSFANIVHFFNANDGVTMGDPAGGYFEIYTTSNGGANWTRVPSSNIPVPLNADEFGYTGNQYYKGNSLWFGTSVGRIYKTYDKGLTWAVDAVTPVIDFGGQITTGVNGQFAFKDNLNGLLRDNSFSLYDTVDGGVTWNPVLYSGEFRNGNLEYINGTPNTYIMNGVTDVNTFDGVRGNSISEDGGLTWVTLTPLQTPVPNTAGALRFFDCTHGAVGGFTTSSTVGGIFLNTHNYCIPLATPTFSNDNAFKASPNPTTGLVALTGKNISNVIVTDVLGKQVSNTNYSSLSNVNLDMTALNAGMYMVKVTSNEGNASTLKVVKQ